MLIEFRQTQQMPTDDAAEKDLLITLNSRVDALVASMQAKGNVNG